MGDTMKQEIVQKTQACEKLVVEKKTLVTQTETMKKEITTVKAGNDNKAKDMENRLKGDLKKMEDGMKMLEKTVSTLKMEKDEAIKRSEAGGKKLKEMEMHLQKSVEKE